MWPFSKKANPAQRVISRDYGDSQQAHTSLTNIQAYERLEVVRRGVDLIVDSVAESYFDVGNIITGLRVSQTVLKAKTLDTKLNYKPNLYQTANDFKRNIVIDLVLNGNAYIYYDGADLFNLPADKVEVITDKVTFVKEYIYGSEIRFSPNEIIHIRDNSARSIYIGASRLNSASDSINTLSAMIKFQKDFFTNGAVPGLVLTTDNVLAQRTKERIIDEWIRNYRPQAGGRRPAVLDGGFKIEPISQNSFKELDFADSVSSHEYKILKALGVPPILLDSGNNANLSPNLKLFYITTVIPLVSKIAAGFERYFGFDIKADFSESLALKPELRDEADYYTKLTNSGVITVNEARYDLRRQPATDAWADHLILPQNIAGSNIDPALGGKPAGGNK